MSLKASNSEKNLMLPVSDPPHGSEEKERLIRGDEKLFRGSAMTKRGAYAALSYMACAVLLVLFNKAALSSYNFPSANVVTLVQMVCSCCFLYALRRSKVISFTVGDSLSDNAASMVPMNKVRQTSPLAGTYLLYMLATMESVRGVNVPMYTTLRRTTVVFTMVVEYLLAGQKYTYSVVGSVGLIVLGAFIAGARDLSFDVYGYSIVFLSNVTTAIYLATISRIGKSSGLNSFGLMWCNGILCAPVLLFWTFIRGDLEATISFPHLFSPGFLAVMFCSCTLAFFLNYSIFLNTTLNSAVTQTICGNLKDFFTIGLGWMIFGGLPFDLLNVIGQLLGFAGSDIQVKRSATVAELKGAVESVFSHMPQDGPGKISWLHVWWHFCLCYAGQKLLDDADYIANFGIKDGDQLQFVRHVTTGYNVIRKQSKKCVVSSKLLSRISSRSKSYKQNDQEDMERYNYNDIESGRFQHRGNNELFMNHEPKMVFFLGGWFSHTKLASAGKMSINSLMRPSGTRPSLVRGFKNLIQLCREKRHYEKVNKKKRSIIGV